MKPSETDPLRERYLNGNATREEERELARFLASGRFSAGTEADAQLFGYQEREKDERSEDAGFERRLQKIADSIPDPARRHRIGLPVRMAAASLLILAGSALAYRYAVRTRVQQTELKETRQLLNLLSARLNSGLIQVRIINNFTEPFSATSPDPPQTH